jgi:hypothetical protein
MIDRMEMRRITGERLDAILANQRNCRDEYLSRSPGIGPITAEAHGAALGMSDWLGEEAEMLLELRRLEDGLSS